MICYLHKYTNIRRDARAQRKIWKDTLVSEGVGHTSGAWRDVGDGGLGSPQAEDGLEGDRMADGEAESCAESHMFYAQPCLLC